MQVIDHWNELLQNKSPQEIIDWAFLTFDSNTLFQTTSFGLSGMVIMDMISKKGGSVYPIDVIFIDTLHHFKETLNLMDRAKKEYCASIQVFKPKGCSTREDFTAQFGDELWSADGAKYAEPGHRAYVALGVKAVFTGRRRTQGADRLSLKIVELDDSLSPPLIKINPLVAWGYEQVNEYVQDKSVPYNALLDMGYKSVGDYHSTDISKEGESERAGRWRGQEKTECGLHENYFELKRAAASKARYSLMINAFGNLTESISALSIHAAKILSISTLDYNLGTLNLMASTTEILQPELFNLVSASEHLSGEGVIHIATVISSKPISFAIVLDILKLFPNVVKIKKLNSSQELKVIEIHVQFPLSLKLPIEDSIFKFSRDTGIDIALKRDSVFARNKRLVVFDMDSTLIQQEVIDELAREAGVYDRISAITESAMRGDIDFDESLRQRVGLLVGTSSEVLEKVKGRITLTPGALELCRALKALGFRLAVLSGGFIPFALHVKQILGLDYAFANNLELSHDAKTLTGRVLGTIVNGQRKAELLSVISQLESVPTKQIIAVGDGANDLLMLASSGMGIAFNAKPKVQKQAEIRLNQPSLLNILYLLGFNEEEIYELIN